MIGGEIFIPKIPSIKITDLAKAIGPNIKQKIIGIRPGEKIHEVLCPKDLAFYTYEFKNYYIIYPPILDEDKIKKLNVILKNGKKVSEDFEYSSGTNKKFLKGKEILKIL